MKEELKKILKEKRNLWLVCFVPAIIMYLVAKSSVSAAENVFARGIYKVYGALMSRITDIFPFSLVELLITLMIIWVPTMIVVGVVRIIKVKEHKAAARIGKLIRMLRDMVLLAGILLLWFMIGCGTNYYRYEFAQFSGLTVKKSTKEELNGLFLELIDKTNEARVKLGAQSDIPFASEYEFSQRAELASKAMQKLSEKYEVLEGYFPDPKPVMGSRFMSYFGITGVYSPFTVEANVNDDIPDYSKGYTMCHELSHLRGFMREDEANFIGYLACVNSDVPELVYSGYIAALIRIGNKLYEADKDLYFAGREKYSEGVLCDMRAANEYWDSFKKTEIGETLSNVGESLNNAYLQANGVNDGTASYGRFADLLLAEYREKNKEN